MLCGVTISLPPESQAHAATLYFGDRTPPRRRE